VVDFPLIQAAKFKLGLVAAGSAPGCVPEYAGICRFEYRPRAPGSRPVDGLEGGNRRKWLISRIKKGVFVFFGQEMMELWGSGVKGQPGFNQQAGIWDDNRLYRRTNGSQSKQRAGQAN
jgi:hypothetical protein